MPLSELYDPGKGFLVNDTCIIEADVAVRKVIDYWTYDSKKETGYVGLKNQGATCYMNSLLQTLYHIPYFRKVSIRVFNFSCFSKAHVLFCIWRPEVSNSFVLRNIRPCIICQQQRMIYPPEAFPWLFKVYFTSYNTTTPVLQQKNWPNLLDGTLMILSCSTMFKSSTEFWVKSLKIRWRYGSLGAAAAFIVHLFSDYCFGGSGDCCGRDNTEVIWRTPYELHWVYQCGL